MKLIGEAFAIGLGCAILYFLSWLWVASLISNACSTYFREREKHRNKMDNKVEELLQKEYHEA
jgi:hypothetical protein